MIPILLIIGSVVGAIILIFWWALRAEMAARKKIQAIVKNYHSKVDVETVQDMLLQLYSLRDHSDKLFFPVAFWDSKLTLLTTRLETLKDIRIKENLKK